MSGKPFDDHTLHERVSLGENACPAIRRSGATLSRSGHVMALGLSNSVAQKSTQEALPRAVRARINSPLELK